MELLVIAFAALLLMGAARLGFALLGGLFSLLVRALPWMLGLMLLGWIASVCT